MKLEELLGLFKVMEINGYLVRRKCLDKLKKDTCNKFIWIIHTLFINAIM
jgi:hypothetical protein